MSQPTFSIVIPTRNRAETLAKCLETCQMQAYEHFEVIVSDNSDTDEARGLVAAINDPRYHYYKTDHVLAMSHNFEFGVSHATGDYIIVIGDDDGLTPYALEELAATAQQYNHPTVIAWEHIFYNWPSMPNPQAKNSMTIPVSTEDIWVDGHDLIQQVIDHKVSYCLMPMLYHRAIHKSVVADLKERTGRVFDSRSPDVYTGYAIAHLVGEYLYKGLPCSVSGISGNSNGAAHVLHTPNKDLIGNHCTENADDGMIPHPKVPDVHCLTTAVAESFEYFRDNFFVEDDCSYTVNAKAWFTWALTTPIIQDEAHTTNYVEKVRQALPFWKNKELTEWVETQLLPNFSAIRASFPRPSGNAHLTRNKLCFNAYTECGVSDVAEAAEASTQVLMEILSNQEPHAKPVGANA